MDKYDTIKINGKSIITLVDKGRLCLASESDAEIEKLKADVAESVDILKLITQSESMNKIVIEQAKAFIHKHNHAV